jgi:hypothetical protein
MTGVYLGWQIFLKSCKKLKSYSDADPSASLRMTGVYLGWQIFLKSFKKLKSYSDADPSASLRMTGVYLGWQVFAMSELDDGPFFVVNIRLKIL